MLDERIDIQQKKNVTNKCGTLTFTGEKKMIDRKNGRWQATDKSVVPMRYPAIVQEGDFYHLYRAEDDLVGAYSRPWNAQIQYEKILKEK